MLGVHARKVKVMHRDSDITTSADGDFQSFRNSMAEALDNPPISGPCIIPVGRTDRWEHFHGAFHMHWFDGNAATRRVHVAMHQLEQQIGCNLVDKKVERVHFRCGPGGQWEVVRSKPVKTEK